MKDRDLSVNPIELDITITIKQTYTRVFVAFVGNDVRTKTTTTSEAYGEISQFSDGDGKFTLRYMFVTDPGSYHPNQSGLATLVLHSGEPDRLVGEWLFNPFHPAAGRIEVSRTLVPS